MRQQHPLRQVKPAFPPRLRRQRPAIERSPKRRYRPEGMAGRGYYRKWTYPPEVAPAYLGRTD